MNKVKAEDVCILVEKEEKKMKLIQTLFSLGVMSQTGDSKVEGSYNYIVVESVRRFKGLESKVVILYNPCFRDVPGRNTKELLYTAVSRCCCLLIVISTKEGCKALKSDVGVLERGVGTSQHTPVCYDNFAGSGGHNGMRHGEQQAVYYQLHNPSTTCDNMSDTMEIDNH